MEDYETQAGKEDRQDEINSMDKQRPPQGGEDQAVPLPELVFLGLVLGGVRNHEGKTMRRKICQ